MGDKKVTLILVLFCFCLIVPTPGIAFASSGNWVEVITFTGSGGIGSTSHFTVDHVDWRIRWEINPGNGSERTSFHAYVFPETSEPSFEEIHHFGTEETTGILNIYNHSGSFYMDVLTGNVESYTMIIEQNIDSIPEFPSWTPLLIMLLAVTVIGAIYKQRLHKRNHRRS